MNAETSTTTPTATTADPPGIWAAIGNIKKPCFIGTDGGVVKPGTKHFRAGAKVYVIDAFWGMCDSVTVIGQHRKSRRFICLAMPAKHLENLRPHLIYSPTIIRLVQEHFGPARQLPGKADAERLCTTIPSWGK